MRLAVSDKVATTSARNIVVEGLKTQDSLYSETFFLNTDNIVKSRSINYQLSINSSSQISDKGEAIPDFAGLVTLNFGFLKKFRLQPQMLIASKTC